MSVTYTLHEGEITTLLLSLPFYQIREFHNRRASNLLSKWAVPSDGMMNVVVEPGKILTILGQPEAIISELNVGIDRIEAANELFVSTLQRDKSRFGKTKETVVALSDGRVSRIGTQNSWTNVLVTNWVVYPKKLTDRNLAGSLREHKYMKLW